MLREPKDVNFLVALKGVNCLAEFRGHEIDGEVRAVHTHTHTHTGRGMARL